MKNDTSNYKSSTPIHEREDGWYFWDIREEYCRGPFESPEHAHSAFKHYCETFLLEEAE